MLIDVEIARGSEVEIERAVPRQQLEHVIEEPDAGPDTVPPAPLDRELQRDLRFRRPAIDHRAAHRTSSITAMNRFVCSTMPAAIRMQPAQPGSVERSRM